MRKTFKDIVIDALCWSVAISACAGMAVWAWDQHMEALSEYQPLVNGQVFEMATIEQKED